MAREAADASLLFGGLDTSIVAVVAAERSRPRAITVCVDPQERIDEEHRDTLIQKLGYVAADFPAPDAAYARLASDSLGLEHEQVIVSLEELLAFAPATVAVIGSFDPMQVRNGLTIYAGLVRARALGCRRVYTGDAADELYAGYSHMWTMSPTQLQHYVDHMATIMNFTTPLLAHAAGVEVVSPFLDPVLVDFAMTLSHDERIGEHDGRRTGKWIVREAARAYLPDPLVWRVRRRSSTDRAAPFSARGFDRGSPMWNSHGHNARSRRRLASACGKRSSCTSTESIWRPVAHCDAINPARMIVRFAARRSGR